MIGYFVLTRSGDDFEITGPLTESELLEYLDRYPTDYETEPRFYEGVPNILRQRGEEGILIIKGSIVVPTPKTTVTSWALPSGGTDD
jgi:hypothetical protein